MLRATRPIGVGQPITLSYGALNNMHSMLSYGFARPEWDLGSFAVRLRDTSFDFRLFHFARAFVAAAAEARAEGAGIRKIWNGAGDGDGTTQPSCGILWRCVDAPETDCAAVLPRPPLVIGADRGRVGCRLPLVPWTEPAVELVTSLRPGRVDLVFILPEENAGACLREVLD